MDQKFLKLLTCPYCKGVDLEWENGKTKCPKCGREFKIENGIPNLLPDKLRSNHESGITNQGWTPGARPWRPDKLSSILSAKKNIKDPLGISKNQGIILDIGSGAEPKGTINLDVYLPNPVPENFVLASAEMLPFKDKSVDVIHSSYLIEHLLSPANFIKDQVRIARNKVIVVTDNSEWIGDGWFRLIGNGRIFHDEHCYRWTVEYLENLIRRLGFKAKVYACNLSSSPIVRASSLFRRLPRIGRWFYRDLVAEIKV